MVSVKKTVKRAVFWVASTAGVVVLTILLTARWQEDLIAKNLSERLVACEEADIEPTLATLGSMGDTGLPYLAQSLSSEREEVARGGYREIFSQIDQWKADPKRTGASVLVLVESLAQFDENSTHYAQAAASRIATDVMLWPCEDRIRLLAACDKILQLEVAGLAQAKVQETPLPATLIPVGAGDGPEHQIVSLAQRPGGGLPLPRIDVPELPAENTLADPREGAGEIPEVLAQNPEATPLRQAGEPGRLGDLDSQPINENRNDASRTAELPKNRLRSGIEAEGGVQAPRIATPEASSNTRGAVATASPQNPQVLELIETLAAADESQRRQAVEALQALGFNETELQLAQRFATADRERRRTIVEVLPQLAGINTRKWLIWLSHAEDAEVRLTAATFMATSDDPEVYERVRQLYYEDADPRVQQVAEKAVHRERR